MDLYELFFHGNRWSFASTAISVSSVISVAAFSRLDDAGVIAAVGLRALGEGDGLDD